MSAQWGRRIQVLVGALEVANWRSDRPAYSLDVAFSVTRHSRLEPQPSSITIWGLNSETREVISRSVAEAREQAYLTSQQVKTSFVTIRAGVSFAAEIAYDAIIDLPAHERDGASWRTEIRAADGRLPWAHGWVSETRSDRVDPIEVATRQQEALGLASGQPGASLAEFAPDLVAQGFRGYAGGDALFGSFTDVNQAITGALGLRYRFSRGQIVWFRDDTAEIVPAIELEEGATLLSWEPPAAFGFRKVRALFDPRLEVGRQVFLRIGGKRAGPYRVDEATYSGATRAVEWYADLLLRPTSL